MKRWYYSIDLCEVEKRLKKYPDTFYLSDIPSVLNVAKATAAEVIRELEPETRHTPDGLAVNKKAFLVLLSEFCDQHRE